MPVTGRTEDRPHEGEKDVSQANAAFSQIQGAVGLFLTGVGVFWFVTVYKDGS